jgi:catechol 2,3-dioxygenase-like lactoylglutathione lyase family enzyme
MPTFEVLGIDHVDLTVNDLGRSIAFYEKVLGALGFRRLPLNRPQTTDSAS